MTKPTIEIAITTFLSLSVVASLILNWQLEIRLIFGIVSLVATVFCLLAKNRDWALSILLFALIFATFNLVTYSVAYNVSAGIRQTTSGFHVGFNIIYFLVLLALLIFRRHEILDLKDKWFEADTEEIEQSKLNRIAIFKRQFGNLPSEELFRKLNDDKMVDDAKIAIQQILAERDMTMNNTL